MAIARVSQPEFVLELNEAAELLQLFDVLLAAERGEHPCQVALRSDGRPEPHSDLSTTLGIYGHQDQRDLERAMEALADAREAEDAASRGNDSTSRVG